jgi:hypothetical protein
MPQLLVALEQREQRAEGEQHDGDQERPEVPLTPEAEGCSAVGARRPDRPPSASRAWLPVSATEWIDSANIEAAPVNRNATNLTIAMPRLARNAARIARVLPSSTAFTAPLTFLDRSPVWYPPR